MSLPKVLVIGQPFNNNTGGGITLSNLFSGWEKDRIAVVSSAHLLLYNVDTTICNTYYQLGHKEQKWVFPFNRIRKKYESGQVEFSQKVIKDSADAKVTTRDRLILRILFPILKYFGVYNSASRIDLSPEFCRWMDDFDPDVIYMQASNRQLLRFCLLVSEYAKKPLIFHMMDDWPATIREHGLFRRYWYRKVDTELKTLVSRASVLMSISDEMAREYKRRYGRDFIAFQNPIDIEFWEKYQRHDYRITDEPSLVYAGRTGPGIQRSLETVAKAIQAVNTSLDISMRFILQIERLPAWASKYDCVEHRAFVPYRELPRVFAEADFLILPYDFSKRSISFIKYSMPTKAPEYMASGTPIIIYAPEVTAIVKYAQEYEWGKVIVDDEVASLASGIMEMVRNREHRQRIAENAKETVEKFHDARQITRRFQTIIYTLAGKPIMNVV